MNIIIFLLGIASFILAVYYAARKQITTWAAENNFFVLLVTNKIKFVTRAGGNIDRIVARLDGYIVEESGEITTSRNIRVRKGNIFTDLLTYIFVRNNDFWVNHFGAQFIGLGKLLTYEIEIIDENGKVSKKNIDYLDHFGEYYIKVERAETEGQFPIDIMLKIVTKTRNARQTIKYGSWLSMVVDPVKAAIRDHVATKKPEVLMKMQNENPTSGKRSDLMQAIFSLNNGIKGNPGLIDEVGQEIIEVNVVSIEISDTELKKALEAKKLAEEKGEADLKTAEIAVKIAKQQADADLKIAVGKAKSLIVIGKAEAETLATKLTSLGGDAQALSNIETAELIGEAIIKTKITTLALNTGVTLGIPSGNTPDKKERKP